MVFLNLLPVYWEPLSHWSVGLEQSDLATMAASTDDFMVTSAVASMLNQYAIHCRVKTSHMLKW